MIIVNVQLKYKCNVKSQEYKVHVVLKIYDVKTEAFWGS